MTGTLARLLKGTRALETRLSTAFERTAQAMAGPEVPAPLELIDRVADALAAHVHPAGRGRYVCPFTRIDLTLVARTPEDRAGLDAVIEGPPSIRERLRRRLVAEGCADAPLDVHVDYVPSPDPAWPRPDFHLALSRGETATPEDRLALRVDVLVTHGSAARSAYSFTTLPIAIGRGAEVRDRTLQLVRVNHVAFAENDDEVNRSVSRRHARIERDRASGRPRIIDDGSAQGTTVIRGGRGLAVPRGSRGLGLQSDDEIVIGQARMRVRLSGT